jgi:MYXO-CTERM domain-containing protein
MDSRPWWAGTILYELSEEHPGGMWPDIHWGLVLRTADPDGSSLDNFSPKPAYTYLKGWLAAAPPGDDAGPGGGPGGAPDDAGPGGGSSTGDAGLEDDDPTNPAGCGCQGASNSASGAHLVGLAGLAMLLRRRRMP